MKTTLRNPGAERGSLLIIAMLLCAVIGLSIVSYLNLGRTGMEISNRALYNNGAMNLAENGLEQAMYSINKKISDPTYVWADHGWTIQGTAARQKWNDYDFGQGARGMVRAYVYDYAAGAAPRIIARSTVTVGGRSSQAIEKWIEVQLRRTSKFANGLVAKETINFSGNSASVDSWNSDPDNNSGTAAIPYSAAVKNSNGSVGSISVAVNAVGVNNADIWGYASTGGATSRRWANAQAVASMDSAAVMSPARAKASTIALYAVRSITALRSRDSASKAVTASETWPSRECACRAGRIKKKDEKASR